MFGPPGVAISSDAGVDRTYLGGDTMQVRLTFNEAVDVTGTPRVRIDLDPAAGGERWADYASGSGTRMLEFEYTVVEGDLSAHGVAVLPEHPGAERRHHPLRLGAHRGRFQTRPRGPGP